MPEYLFENICLLLWEKDKIHEKWPKRLAEWVGWPPQQARKWLFSHHGGSESLSQAELEHIAQANDLPGVEELRYDWLLKAREIPVLQENFRYLAEIALEHGRKKELANKSGVTQSTVSKWLKGTHVPRKENLEAITDYFGLPAGTDLETDPVFLSPIPASLRQMRQFLKERLDTVTDERLRKYFPALEELLRDE